jgi:hypothetical protein
MIVGSKSHDPLLRRSSRAGGQPAPVQLDHHSHCPRVTAGDPLCLPVLARIWHGRSLGYEPNDASPQRLACSLPCCLAAVVLLGSARAAFVSGVLPDPGASRAQVRAHGWHGVRSSPRSGTPWATPGSPGRQGSARGPIEASPCRPAGSGVGLCLPGRGDDPFASPISEGGPGCGAAPREKADGFIGYH